MKENWNGEGFPPVGTECETIRGNFWKPCKIVAHVESYGETKAIFQLNEDWGCTAWHNLFRPIKSDRNKAVEEMELLMHKRGYMINPHAYAELYDLGYRKTTSGE